MGTFWHWIYVGLIMNRYIIVALLFVCMSSVSHAQKAPNNMHAMSGVVKGAVPGFAKKPRYFNSRVAEENLSYLYHQQDVRLVISLDHCNDVAKVIRKMNTNLEPPIEHLCRKIRRATSQYKNNVSLFEEIASSIGSVKFYIHCRYGAHRAVTALTGAWIARQRLTFEEAFEKAGGKKRAFRSKGQKELLNQAKKYAHEKRGDSGCGEKE